MKLEVKGLDEVNEMLATISPREARNLLRATVHGAAGQIRDDAKAAMPTDTGTMKGATKSKRRRGAPNEIRSDVVVERSAWYWRFLEYGQGPDGVEHAMFLRAAEKFRAAMVEVFTAQFGRKWEAALKRAAKKRGR